MAVAVFLRSVARKMSLAAAPTTNYYRSLVARGLHGGVRSGPAISDQIEHGTPDGMAAATGLRSGAGWLWLMTKMARAQPPPYHRRRRIHSRTSPDLIPSVTDLIPSKTDLIPSMMKKALDATTFDTAASSIACIVLASAAIYFHFRVKPKVEKITAQYKDLLEKTRTASDHERDLRATIRTLEAENAELNIALLDSARSQVKV